MAAQHSPVPITLIKLHSIIKKLDQDPMRVPRKVAFIIVLTNTICTAQKASFFFIQSFIYPGNRMLAFASLQFLPSAGIIMQLYMNLRVQCLNTNIKLNFKKKAKNLNR